MADDASEGEREWAEVGVSEAGEEDVDEETERRRRRDSCSELRTRYFWRERIWRAYGLDYGVWVREGVGSGRTRERSFERTSRASGGIVCVCIMLCGVSSAGVCMCK